jgi:hypothetical protein
MLKQKEKSIAIKTRWARLADEATVHKTAAALRANGIEVHTVASGAEAKQTVFELLPPGASVMTMTSMTLDTIGVTQEILESGNYEAVKNKLNQMDRAIQHREMQQLGAAPEWAIGSVHAVTEHGQVLIASNTGSQLPAYAYGADHVMWVVGTQKIVKDVDTGIKRIYEHSFPLEDVRARKAYGTPSGVSKILIINKEKQPKRLTLILVNEVLGF